ncbi:MAG: hypothetical protein Q8L22_24885 [Reyranella sp.]|nr:hypothetical protein [Reyranella sp.]
MKIAWLLSLVATVGVAGVAEATTWEANNLLLPARSASGCPDHHDRYKFELVGTIFTGHNVNGPLFVTTVAPDGAVDLDFKSPGGASLEISGNAKARDLEIFNSKVA